MHCGNARAIETALHQVARVSLVDTSTQVWRNVGVKDRFRPETSTQIIIRCNVTKYDYIQMLNKVEGDDDETILTNSKWSLGQLKTKNSSVPTKRTRSESKFNPVNIQQ